MEISLKESLEQFVTEKVQGGQYADASAIVNEALEVLREQEEFAPEHEAYLRQELGRGMDQLARGELSTLDAEKIIAQERERASHRKGMA